MKQPIGLCLLLLVATTGSEFALAWGQSGHRTICNMAYKLVDSNRQRKLMQLLRAVPQAHIDAINAYQKMSLDTPLDFASACVWADAVKNRDQYKGMKTWHFVNVQRSDTALGLEDCLGGCVLLGILHHTQVLNTHRNSWERVQSLLFLGHWVGDVHQPLHVSYKDDLGGNDTIVRNSEIEDLSLHFVWDSFLIKKFFTKKFLIKKLFIKGSAKKENKLADELLSTISTAQRNTWVKQDPFEWAEESLDITRQKKTFYCKVALSGYCKKIPSDNGISYKIPENYFQQHWPTVERRMQQAAVRLAWILTKSL